ncbi:UNVERIFIED_CONTAM: hypothetical protein GTU68_041927 [Idotea baltica]|nr:hypothetical protein [Idotea baltica]
MGKTMIQRVYERCKEVLVRVYVATDDHRIADHVRSFGGESIMTSTNHLNGSSRCLEATQLLVSQGHDANIILNIQGDEPYIDTDHIKQLIKCFENKDTEIASLAYVVPSNEEMRHGEGVFVVLDDRQRAIYFSRSIIPYHRDIERSLWSNKATYYRHIGTYGYTIDALKRYNQMAVSPLEKIEKLEQLRWIYHGGAIQMAIANGPSFGVDTPEDLARLIRLKSK